MNSHIIDFLTVVFSFTEFVSPVAFLTIWAFRSCLKYISTITNIEIPA